MKKWLLMALALFSAGVYGVDLMKEANVTWRMVEAEGGKGEMKKLADGSYQLTKTNDAGHLFFLAAEDQDIIPGKRYEAKIDFASGTPGMIGNIMVSMPGSTRTPYPVGKAVTPANGPCSADLTFVAKSDENKLRIVAVIKGQGSIVVSGVSIAESLPDKNLLKQQELGWYAVAVEGANGSGKMLPDGNFEVKKTNDTGVVFFVNNETIAIVKDKTYEVSAEYTSSSEALQGYLMLSMPGSGRTPYPVSNRSGEKGLNNVSMTFTARFDEKFLKIHLCLVGDPGTVIVRNVSIKEIDPEEAKKKTEVTELVFDAKALDTKFQKVGSIKNIKNNSAVEFVTGPTGGISCDTLRWEAKDIDAIEVQFSSADEGGYLKLEFTSRFEGKDYHSYLNMSTWSDGEFHTLLYPVKEDPAWRGVITAIRFSWMSTGNGAIAFRKIAALDTLNLIPDAALLVSGEARNIPMIKPRGHYTLKFTEARHPAGKIEFRDRDAQKIGEVVIPADAGLTKFTVPALTMTALYTPDGKVSATNFPVLQLVELPHLNNPPAYWRGSWIWSQSGFGPNNTNIWFEREITLDSPVENAAFVAAGDDVFELFVNGVSVGGGSIWEIPERFDIAKYLKVGKNRIVVRVFNFQAWGGFIGEGYVKLKNGDEILFPTDDSWHFFAGGDKMPESFPSNVMVLGAPPVAPWGTRLGYKYVGDIGEIEILGVDVENFKAKIHHPVAVGADELFFRVVDENGQERKVKGVIKPGTADWKKGETVQVHYTLPPESGKKTPSKVYLDSEFIQVRDNASVGFLRNVKQNKPGLAQVRIENTGVRPMVVVNGEKKLAPIYYDMPGTYRTDPDGRDFLLRNAANAGCDFIRFGTDLSSYWLSPGQYDFSGFDRLMEVFELNAGDAMALVILRCSVPEWWLEQNPDDATGYYGNLPRHPQKDKQALASKKWLDDMSEVLRAFIRHVKNQGYADRLIGFAVSEGWNSEWFWSYADMNDKPAMSGFSKADLATFRDTLRKKYANDAELAKAYNRPGLTFATVEMPSPERMNQSSIGTLLDPVRDRDIIDYFDFRNIAIGEAIEAFCKVIKEESDGRMLAGAYYGYLVAFSNIYNHLQSVGHLAIHELATSPAVDFVIAPSFYTWRRLGMNDGVMQPADAFSAHGKLVIVEQDIRTYSQSGDYEATNGKLYTVDQSIGGMNRAFAMLATRGLGTHYMEMYECWFREPVILDLIKEQLRVYKNLPKVSGSTPNEVCIVSDDESPLFVKHNQGDGVHQGLIAGLLRRIHESGFAYTHVLGKDLMMPGVVAPQKFYIITNLLKMTAEERRQLTERFEKEKATVLYLYGPGFTDGNSTPSAENVAKTLGIPVRMETAPLQLKALFADGLGRKEFTDINQTSPHFFATGAFDEVLAKDGKGEPVLVGWKKNGVQYYFSSLSLLPPEVLRNLARRGGVWIYGESGDPIYAGNDLVFLYAKTAGTKSLHIPAGYELIPVIGPWKKTLQQGQTFDAVLGQTYGFRLAPKENQ